MQLRVARLCLDCEEIHDSPQCPLCTSEAFAYLTRWVPARDGRPAARPVQTPPITAGKRASRGKAVGLGIAGIGILGLARWFSKGRDLIEDAATRNIGELK